MRSPSLHYLIRQLLVRPLLRPQPSSPPPPPHQTSGLSTSPPPPPQFMTTTTTPVVPRRSASLLLLTPTSRLLLLQRPSTISFAHAYVFPGGALSPSDHNSPRFAALRETFEETGVLLTSAPTTLPSSELFEARTRVHNGTLNFSQWLFEHGAALVDDAELLSFSTWTTPPGFKRRYENVFFIARLPAWMREEEVERGFMDVGDAMGEVVEGSCRFLGAREALEMNKRGEIGFFPPQFWLLTKVAELLKGESVGGGGEGWKRIKDWSEKYGDVKIAPRKAGEERAGKVFVTLGDGGGPEDTMVLEVPRGGGGPKTIDVRGKSKL